MNGWLRTIRNAGSLTGTVLIVLGTFLLYENAVGVLASVTRDGALRTLPAILLAVDRLVELYATLDRSRLLECLIGRAMFSIWPVVLVLAGTILTRIP